MNETIAYLGLIEDEAILLDAAAIELAALDHPGVDLKPYVALLNRMVTQLSNHIADAESPRERSRALAAVIVGQYGFRGDSEHYDDPVNADLIAVLGRRRGLPVALAILFVALARRVGWDAEALNMPGHVLVRVGCGADAAIVDPFNGGEMVDGRKLAALLARVLGRGIALKPEHLAPMTNRTILVRLLLNQSTRAAQAGDVERALALYQRMTLIAPAGHGLWWERVRLEQALGRSADARASLSAMLEITRDPDQRTHISAALESLPR